MQSPWAKSKLILATVATLSAGAASAVPIVSAVQGVNAPPQACETKAGDPASQVWCSVPTEAAQARSTWLAQVSDATFEEFETAGSRVKNAPALFGGTATLTSDGAFNGFYDDPFNVNTFLGRYNTTGGGGYGWFFETGNGTTTIRFNSPIEAFGFYLTDLGDESGSATLTLKNGDTTLDGGLNIAVAPRDQNGNVLPLSTLGNTVLFFGVTSDGTPFDSVTLNVALSALGAIDYIGMDSLIIGNIDNGRVPTPGTLALAGLALLGLRRFRSVR